MTLSWNSVLSTLAEVNDAKGESDGHPIIGHYVIGRHTWHQKAMSCAPDGRWPFPFLRNGDYLTPAFTDSPHCARFARRLAHSHGSLR